ncbi:M16 family metallopeptidase [Rudaeicoccus suwonensis]|uniref:Putative Zn-dependent peptidase n=1 Tax=Rudaeicoccus suwonensis TaxID=657409 RepID=A0A561E1F8_9MICO|nr:pitrilysin family protein [Rudaeicoccus suwonensis]TWE09439.1 putative Zn-dependent peptidase [Rudaeicoccus suwonensis]
MPLDYPVTRHRLDNGLRVVVSQDHSAPIVAVNLWVGVGSRHEQPGRTGFAHLFEHLMFQGSANVAEGEHFSLLLAQGAQLNATTWCDRTNYFETVPSEALDLALWLEADRHGRLLPAVTQANLDNQRDVVKEEKRQRYDNVPYGEAMTRLGELVFPQGHPYHHSTIGSMADLDAASVDDVHAFYERHYRPDNTVLTLVGDITEEAGFAAAERYFGELTIPEQALPEVVSAPLPPLSAPLRLDITADVPADRTYLGFRLPADGSPEFTACELAFDLLAGLATSRLYRRMVRGEQLVTHVSRSATGRIDGTSMGMLVFDAAEGVSADRAEEVLCEELERLAQVPPTEVEMAAVGADIERWWLQGLAQQDERADTICGDALLHDDPGRLNAYLDRVAAITAEDVCRAAATYLDPAARAVVRYAKEGN